MNTLPLPMEDLLRHRAWVRSLARELVHDQADVDDLVQDAWLAALEARSGAPQRVRAWLGGILRNQARERRRSEGRRSAREERAALPEAQPSAHDLAEQAEQERRLVTGVLAMEERDRSIVLLHYFGDLSCAQIARREGVPQSTVRNRLKRALDGLRERLDSESKGDRRAWCLALVPVAVRAETGASMFSVIAAAAAVCALLGLVGTVAVEAVRRAASADLNSAQISVPDENPFVIASREADQSQPGAEQPASVEASRVEAQAAPPAMEADPVAGPTMRVRVLSHDERPLADATVTMDGREYAADSDGVCALPMPGVEVQAVRLGVDAPGFFHVRANYSVKDELEVRLARAGRVTGRVLDLESRAALAGVSVQFAHDRCRECEAEHTNTDAQGAFAFDRVPIGESIGFLFSIEGYPKTHRMFTLEADSTAACEVLLDRGVLLRGHVFDLQSGRALEGATISDAGGGNPETTTDARGLFSFRVERMAGFEAASLRASAKGYCGFSASTPLPSSDSDAPIEIALLKAAAIEGFVLDSSGLPIRAAGVQFYNRGGGHSTPVALLPAAREAFKSVSFATARDAQLKPAPGATFEAECDERGFFRIEGLIPWIDKSGIRAFAPGHAPVVVMAESMPGPGGTLSISAALPPAGRIEGRLTLNGEPLAGHVSWRGEQGNSTQTDREGGFAFDGVEVGRVVLVASVNDPHRRGLSGLPEFEADVRAGEMTHVDLALHVEFATVRGRVITSSGSPVSGAYLTAASEVNKSIRIQATTDEFGDYSLELPAERGPYSMYVSNGPDTVVREHVPAGAENVDFVVASLGRVQFRVRDAATQATLTSMLELAWRPSGERKYRESMEFASEAPTAEGVFTLELPEGEIDLMISDRGHAPARRSIVVAHADGVAPQRIEFELEPGRIATFRLAEDATQLPKRCEIYVLETDVADAEPAHGVVELRDNLPYPLGLARLLRFDEHGVAKVSQLGSGKYRLVSRGETLVFEPVEFEAPAADSKPIELRWRRAGER